MVRFLVGGKELSNPFKSKFSVEEAAKFLRITEERLALLTSEGDIRQCQHRGKRYYLGGELDCAKILLGNREKN